jgi:hypothetical protein
MCLRKKGMAFGFLPIFSLSRSIFVYFVKDEKDMMMKKCRLEGGKKKNHDIH